MSIAGRPCPVNEDSAGSQMLARGFEALRLTFKGGSAFTKNCRPSSLTTLVIWPLAPGAKKFAQRTSVPEMSHVVIVVRLCIMPLR
jgi:hypothetical protein